VTRLLTLGETLGVAVTAPGDPLRTARSLRLSTAGAESTVAIGMRRLGHEAVWVGVVGDDELGARVIRDLSAEGVDVRFVRTTPTEATGFMLRELRTAELTRVSYYRDRSAGAQLAPYDIEGAFAADVGLVHVTGITLALGSAPSAAVQRAVQLARIHGASVSFDVNYRSALGEPSTAADAARKLLPEVDVLFVGDDELHLLTTEPDPVAAAHQLATAGPAEVIVKCGAEGSVAVTADGRLARYDAWPVQVVDAIGAGDSFTAGYLAARAEALPVPDRLRWATICAAATVGSHGDWEGLPTRGELDRRRPEAVFVR
jgi:2-dehydro-3-deoxygluconokinase